MFVLANKAARIQMLQSKRKFSATKEQGKQQLDRIFFSSNFFAYGALFVKNTVLFYNSN